MRRAVQVTAKGTITTISKESVGEDGELGAAQLDTVREEGIMLSIGRQLYAIRISILLILRKSKEQRTVCNKDKRMDSKLSGGD